jgi:hypothetical protein
MKTLARTILFVASLALGATGLIAATPAKKEASLQQLIKETKSLERATETSAQHRILAANYRLLAERQLEESRRWVERTNWYSQFPIYSSDKFRFATIDHSRYLAHKYEVDAHASQRLAARHEGLAG